MSCKTRPSDKSSVESNPTPANGAQIKSFSLYPADIERLDFLHETLTARYPANRHISRSELVRVGIRLMVKRLSVER